MFFPLNIIASATNALWGAEGLGGGAARDPHDAWGAESPQQRRFRLAVAQIAADKRALERDMLRLESEIANRESRAVTAMMRGREELAQSLVGKIVALEDEQNRRRQHAEALGARLRELKASGTLAAHGVAETEFAAAPFSGPAPLPAPGSDLESRRTALNARLRARIEKS